MPEFAALPAGDGKTSFYTVLSAVWKPGLGLALCSVGFGVIEAFIALLFTAHRWGNASLAFTAFGLAFIAARIAFGHLPDRLGGARVALICVVIEAVGQLFIWRADTVSWPTLARRLPALATRWLFPDLAWKPYAALLPKPAVWQWGRTLLSLMFL